MMTDDECDQVYRTLSARLIELNAGWIVDEVEEEIRDGRDTVVRVRPVREDVGSASEEGGRPSFSRQTGSPQNLLRTVPYTSKERLHLLVDAIEAAVVDTADMEVSFFKAVADATSTSAIRSPTMLQFADPDTGATTHEVSVTTSGTRQTAAQLLRRQLGELRREI
jgi:hypothetical protein